MERCIWTNEGMEGCYKDAVCVQSIHIVVIQYPLGHREILQLDHRENKALGLSQLSVFIAVAMNTDVSFSYQCIHFIFSMIEVQIFSMIEPVLLLHV